MRPKNRPPSHPGDVLQKIFLDDLGFSQSDLARHVDCKPGKINEIVRKKRGVTAAFALVLADVFQTSPEFWLNLQSNYDLHVAQEGYEGFEPIGA